MPGWEAPSVELGNAPGVHSVAASSSPSDLSSASSPEPQQTQATQLFRVLAMPPPPPVQPEGQEELERRLPGYRRIVFPRELTLIEILKQSNGVATDELVLGLRSARLQVVAERVGLRRLNILTPHLRALNLDGSALTSLRDLGTELKHLKELHVCSCGLTSFDGIFGLSRLRELYAAGNKIRDLEPLAALHKMHTLDLSNTEVSESTRIWTLGVCYNLRRLSFQGSPIASMVNYYRTISRTLPTLQFLDDFPLNDSALNEIDELFRPPSSSSESEDENNSKPKTTNHRDAESSASESEQDVEKPLQPDSTRPATAPCAGVEPAATALRRPHTAHDSHPSRSVFSSLLQLNSIVDEGTRCTGSHLTSGDALCGNIARALRPRRVSSANAIRRSAGRERHCGANNACVCTLCDHRGVLEQAEPAPGPSTAATEIPLSPGPLEWVAFRRNTGIDFHLNHDQWPDCGDSTNILTRLEKIERETKHSVTEDDNKTNEINNIKKDEEKEDSQIDFEMRLLDSLFNN